MWEHKLQYKDLNYSSIRIKFMGANEALKLVDEPASDAEGCCPMKIASGSGSSS